jgi:broad specificity phosphatase PhoE
MKIILVRHGESEGNAKLTENKDSSLTKKGRMQAESLGRKLKKEKIKIDEIYTSNLIRSRQTGEIISKHIKVPIKGSFEGLNEYRSHNLRYRLTIFNFRLKRLKKSLAKITKNKEEDKVILIVAHGITNRIIIGLLLKIPLRRQLLRLWQYNTAISVLAWNNGHKNWGLESLNDISHLQEKLR